MIDPDKRKAIYQLHLAGVPLMAAFAEHYGFQFLCHAIRHSNRKAGEERSFWTVETNFLPGRSFQSLEDLNRQALEWASPAPGAIAWSRWRPSSASPGS